MRPFAICAAFILAGAAPLLADLSGTWKGVLTMVSTGCEPDVPHGGPITLTLNQNGSNLSGTLSIKNHLSDCTAIEGQTVSASLTGTASGDSFSAESPFAPGFSGTLNGTVSGNEMSLWFAVGDTSGSGVLSKSTTPGNFAGTWTGGFSAVATFCDPPVVQSGSWTFTINQSGSSANGTITTQAGYEDCQPTSGETITIPVQAQVSGNVFTASINAGPDLPGELSAFIRGDQLTIAFIVADTVGVSYLTRGNATNPLTGTWSGSMEVDNSECSSYAFDSDVTLALVQSGTGFTSNLIIDAERDHQEECADGLGEPYTIAVPVSGTASGTSVSGQLTLPDGGIGPFTGSISGQAMTLNMSLGEETRTFHLTRTSSANPSGPLTGTYSGNYLSHFKPCCSGQMIQYGGTMSITLLHTGRGVSGVAILNGLKGDDGSQQNCEVIDVPVAIGVVGGVVDGNELEAIIAFAGDDDPVSFQASITPSSIIGTAEEECEGESFSFNLSRAADALPTIASFTATPSTLALGRGATLQWSTLNATTVSIDQGLGPRAPSGLVTVFPLTSTTYTLTASNAAGSTSATATITVTIPPAEVVVTSRPAGMLQESGGANATDSYTLTNLGGTATTITLSQNGSFFSQSPGSFELAAGASQIVNLTSTTQQANVFDGTSTPSGTGVPSGLTIPVRLYVTTRPTGTVQPRATQTRVIKALGVQSVQSSAQFTNSGNATVQAIAVSDAPWIEPQTGIITIPPAQTATVNFTLHPSRRPDADNPIGGATGSLSLRFLEGTANSAGRVTTHATSIGNASMSIVTVVTPGTQTETPGGLDGDLALFVSGLGSQSSAAGDLLVSFLGTSPSIPTLKMFHAAAGSTSFKSATFNSVSTAKPLSFQSVASSVFGSTFPVSSVQVRSPEISKVSLAATRVNTTNSSGTYAAALPVLRSDRGVASNGQIVLPGVFKSSAVQTNLYLQEVSGSAGTIRVEFLGANGSVVSSRPSTAVRAWELIELADIAPANAVAARITNTSSGAARIAGYGLVTAPSTAESWVVEDPVAGSGGMPDTLYIPIATPGTGAETWLFTTNRGSTNATVTVDVIAARSKRRSARVTSSGGSARNIQPHSTFTLGPGSSQIDLVTSTSSGYIRIRSGAGAVSVAARSAVSTSPDGRPVPYGGSLPPLPAGAALATGQSSRFTGIEDTASSTGPGAFRSNLVVIETTGASAVVRVRLNFTFSAASKATAIATSTRDYTIAASGLLEVNDVIRSVIGDVRDSFGDLHAIQMDVEVASGDGRILPYVKTVDAGSGDLVVRTR